MKIEDDTYNFIQGLYESENGTVSPCEICEAYMESGYTEKECVDFINEIIEELNRLIKDGFSDKSEKKFYKKMKKDLDNTNYNV